MVGKSLFFLCATCPPVQTQQNPSVPETGIYAVNTLLGFGFHSSPSPTHLLFVDTHTHTEGEGKG